MKDSDLEGKSEYSIQDIGVIDFIVAAYSGDDLVLRAGFSSSGWSTWEIHFHEVLYMAIPTMFDQASIHAGSEAARERVRVYCDELDEETQVFELVESPWFDQGGRALPAVRHVIAAKDVRVRKPEASR
jgi:hypothetical protein